jgi:hypothetical protein
MATKKPVSARARRAKTRFAALLGRMGQWLAALRGGMGHSLDAVKTVRRVPGRPAPAAKNDDEEVVSLAGVREKEKARIDARRAAVGLLPTSSDLVGLALSGGGIRSSMFNLGVLQGLHSTGMIRHIDYLVTVSGGGFIGGFLTAQLNKVNQREKSSSADGQSHRLVEMDPTHPLYAKFPLAPEARGQCPSVRNLTRRGNYLQAPIELALRVVSGVILHLFILGSLLIAVTAGLAWFWRVPDMVFVRDWLPQFCDNLDSRRLGPWSTLCFWLVLSCLLVPTMFELDMHLIENKVNPGENASRWRLTGQRRFLRWRATGLFGLMVLFGAAWTSWSKQFGALYRDWYDTSDVIRALLPFGVIWIVAAASRTIRQLLIVRNWKSAEGRVQPARGRFVGLVHDFALIAVPGGVVLSILTMLANGDTDMGNGLSRVVGRFLPEAMHQLGRGRSYLLHIRNDRPFADSLSKITQVLLLLQVVSGIIPLLLPKQFVRSGQAPSSSPQGVLYRFVVLMLMVSMPLLATYLFLHENVSGALSNIGSLSPPIYRLEVCRDPWSGAYANLITHDQDARLRWCLLGASVFFLLNGLVDLNRTSLHQFYRERLKRTYFGAFDNPTFDPTEKDGLRETRLYELENDITGAPYHLIVATMAEIQPGDHMLDSGCSFTFSPDYCGWVRHHPLPADSHLQHVTQSGVNASSGVTSNFVATKLYGLPTLVDTPGESGWELRRGLRIIDALAISGAAITPTQALTLTDSLLLMAVNARLGQWLPNPARPRENRFFRAAQWERAGIPRLTTLALINNALKREPDERECCFLTDGAHHDNLGLEPLFDRGCRLIILSDASDDPTYTFGDLAKVLRRLRANQGIRFSLVTGRPSQRKRGAAHGQKPTKRIGEHDLLEPGDFRQDPTAAPAPRRWNFFGDPPSATELKGRLCRAHHLILQFQYPEDVGSTEEGYLVVLKPSLTGDEDRFVPGLLSYARTSAYFPMDPDLNQNFDESQCEFYRALGVHVARCMFHATPNGKTVADKEETQRNQHDRFERIAQRNIRDDAEFKKSLWCESASDHNMLIRYNIEDFKINKSNS